MTDNLGLSEKETIKLLEKRIEYLENKLKYSNLNNRMLKDFIAEHEKRKKVIK